MNLTEVDQAEYTVIDGAGLSKRIGITETTYTKALCNKEIKCFVVNGRIKVLKKSLDKWLDARQLSQFGGQD